MDPNGQSQAGQGVQRSLDYLNSVMTLTSDACLDVVARVMRGRSRKESVEELRKGLHEMVKMESNFKDCIAGLDSSRERLEKAANKEDFSLKVDKIYVQEKEKVASEVSEVEVAKHRHVLTFEENLREFLDRGTKKFGLNDDDEISTTQVRNRKRA